MVSLAARMFVFGKYTSLLAVVAHWAPFAVLAGGVIALSVLR